MYTKKLPPKRELRLAAGLVAHFPASARTVKRIANLYRMSPEMDDFLELFPDDEVFDTREDFYSRANLLELLIKEEKKMPKEVLRSPQD